MCRLTQACAKATRADISVVLAPCKPYEGYKSRGTVLWVDYVTKAYAFIYPDMAAERIPYLTYISAPIQGTTLSKALEDVELLINYEKYIADS